MRPVSFVSSVSPKFRYAGVLMMIAAVIVMAIDFFGTPDSPHPVAAATVPQARQSTQAPLAQPMQPVTPSTTQPRKPAKPKPVKQAAKPKQKAKNSKPAARKTEPVTSPSTVDSGDSGPVAVAFAKAQLGKPYKWGGAGPAGFDCSGLVMRAWQAAGVELPHRAAEQWRAGVHVNRSQLRPGDLVLANGLGHVQMYIGDGKVVEAPHPGASVRITALPARGIVGYVRPAGGTPVKTAPQPSKASAPVAKPVPVKQAANVPVKATVKATPAQMAPVKAASSTKPQPVAKDKVHAPTADQHHVCPLNHCGPRPSHDKAGCVHANHLPTHNHRSRT